MESELHELIMLHRSKGRKASKSSIKINTKKLILDLQPDKADIFCASEIWIRRFCKRKSKKIGKKSLKKNSGEDNLDVIKKVSEKNLAL